MASLRHDAPKERLHPPYTLTTTGPGWAGSSTHACALRSLGRTTDDRMASNYDSKVTVVASLIVWVKSVERMCPLSTSSDHPSRARSRGYLEVKCSMCIERAPSTCVE